VTEQRPMSCYQSLESAWHFGPDWNMYVRWIGVKLPTDSGAQKMPPREAKTPDVPRHAMACASEPQLYVVFSIN